MPVTVSLRPAKASFICSQAIKDIEREQSVKAASAEDKKEAFKEFTNLRIVHMVKNTKVFGQIGFLAGIRVSYKKQLNFYLKWGKHTYEQIWKKASRGLHPLTTEHVVQGLTKWIL